MTKNALFIVVAAISGLSFQAGSVRAQAPVSACAADVEKYCKDVPPGGGGRYRCLKDHEKDLSEPCRKHIADVQGRVRGIRQACWDDVSRFCADVPRGRGRVLQCLRDHENDLSDQCKAAVTPPKK